MHRLFAVCAAAILLCNAMAPAHAVVFGKPVHAIALYGEPKYGPDFTHFDYVNADTPKGGTFVKMNESYLTFDTFNPYTIKGASAQGLELLLYGTLMTPSQDEPATVYALIAESAEIAPDNTWVQFVIRPEAKFTDGHAVTADDVVFSFDTFMTKAKPAYRTMYANVAKAEAVQLNTVRFAFKSGEDRKLAFQLAKYLPVISKSYWKDRDFTATTLEVPVTNGPYVIDTFEPGKFLTYKRVADYWGKDLPVNRGLWNFDHVRFDYYRDDDVAFEAFKTGNYDFKREVSSRHWVTAYDFPAVTDGRVKKLDMKSILPATTQPIFLNLRRSLFQDRRVREALNLCFDFDAMNNNLFYHQYVRSRSFWQGSPLEATGVPSAAELKLLEPFRDKVPPEVFTAEFTQAQTAGDGDARENLLKARELLKQAGWEPRDGKLTDTKTGHVLAFEILNDQQSMERVYLPFTQNLKRLGIDATVRTVDTSQYINRLNAFDFDATIVAGQNDLTPGADQADAWGSEAADIQGSGNIGGLKDPVIDALAAKIISADTYDELTAATHALDRVLTWNFYQVLTYTSPIEHYAYWSKLKMPDVNPALGIGQMGGFSIGMGESAIALWWADPAGAQAASTPTQPPAVDAVSQPPSSNNRWIIPALAIAGALVVVFFIRRRNRNN